MYKKGLVILLIAIMFLGFNISTVVAEKELASEKIKVIVNIPVYQELQVIEPIVIENANMLDAQKNGESAIINDVGKIRVKSNTSWKLQLDSIDNNPNYDIWIRENGDSEWQIVSSRPSFTGENGDSILKFDLKIVAKEISVEQKENRSINFRYSLFEI